MKAEIDKFYVNGRSMDAVGVCNIVQVAGLGEMGPWCCARQPVTTGQLSFRAQHYTLGKKYTFATAARIFMKRKKIVQDVFFICACLDFEKTSDRFKIAVILLAYYTTLSKLVCGIIHQHSLHPAVLGSYQDLVGCKRTIIMSLINTVQVNSFYK